MRVMQTVERSANKTAAGSMRANWRLTAFLALIVACAISRAPDPIDDTILGRKPSYGPARVSQVPNLPAIDRMIWMAGLDAGWDPQGLAFAEGSLLISAYRSTEIRKNRGPCRVFRIDPVSGNETGHFDIPAPCGHAGGLAYADHGKLFITDTHTLFETDLDKAFDRSPPKFRIFPLGRGVKGAFAVSDHGALWIGDYETNGPAKAFKFALSTIEHLAEGATLDAAAASIATPIPSYGQGGAVDASGRFWISRSEIGWGFLDKVDPDHAQRYRRYPVPAGIEGAAFDEDGKLWVVSETGARHLPWRYPFFPLIFRIDPARLKPAE